MQRHVCFLLRLARHAYVSTLTTLDERRHSLPPACLEELAHDALSYAKLVTTAKRESWEPKVYFWIEYAKILKVHAFACYCLLNRLGADNVAAFKKHALDVKLVKDFERGIRDPKLMELQRRHAMEQPTIVAAQVEMVRDGVGAFDMEAQRAASELVKSGRTWEPQRAVLRKAGLLPENTGQARDYPSLPSSRMPKQWLTRRVTVDEAESGNMVSLVKLGPKPVPFGYSNDLWRELIAKMQTGGERWSSTALTIVGSTLLDAQAWRWFGTARSLRS